MNQQSKAERWGPLCGVGFVVLIIVSFVVVWSSPMSNASGAKVVSWYSNSGHRRDAYISVILADIGVVAGLFFYGYLRERLQETDLGKRLAPIAFGGAVIFAVGGLIGSGTTLALADVPKHLSPSSAQALNVLNNDLFAAALAIGVSILSLASSIVFLKSKMVPTWFGWFGVLIAVAGVAGPLGFFAFMAEGLWVLILSYLLYSRPAAPVQDLRPAEMAAPLGEPSTTGV